MWIDPDLTIWPLPDFCPWTIKSSGVNRIKVPKVDSRSRLRPSKGKKPKIVFHNGHVTTTERECLQNFILSLAQGHEIHMRHARYFNYCLKTPLLNL